MYSVFGLVGLANEVAAHDHVYRHDASPCADAKTLAGEIPLRLHLESKYHQNLTSSNDVK